MVTYTSYVIATLTAVCLVTAWPQHRSSQPISERQDYLDRVVWGSEERPFIKTLSTPANSPNIARPGVTKPNTRRFQRLQSGFQLEQDVDTRQQQQASKHQSVRGVQMDQEDLTRRRQMNNNQTSRGVYVTNNTQSGQSTQGNASTVNSRAHSSQQDVLRPAFQPRGHQQSNNQSKQTAQDRMSVGEGTRMTTQNGSSGRTTSSPRGVGNVTMNGERARDPDHVTRVLPEGRGNGSRDDSEMSASQDAGARSRHVDPLASERNLPRWGSNKGTRVKLPNESIVFPGPSHDDKGVLQQRHFIPRVEGERPRCADSGDTFCTDSNTDYPIEHLNRILEQQSVVFRNFFSTDVVPEANNIAQRFDDTQDDKPICVSEEHVVFPKVAQNKDNDWLYIVNLNQEEYKQGVRIEKCRSPGDACAYSEGFPLSVQTFCKQKYIYRQMLALTQDGTPKADAFKLPSCCACHTMSMGDTVSRMGSDAGRQTPAPKRKKRRS